MLPVTMWMALAPGVLMPATSASNFDDDVEFLKEHVKTIVLTDSSGRAKVAVVPQYQGRVMTSTDGASGMSYGWLNRELISSGELREHINAFGGEDRFWIGPEGGQFSIYFPPGSPFDLEHWQTPPPIDSIAYPTVAATKGSATFVKRFELQNYIGFKFDVEVTRVVRVVETQEAERLLGVDIPSGVHMVCVETKNTIKNHGKSWDEDTGLLSIWILGMLNASPTTTVAVPYVTGSASRLGPIVNDTYFGKVPADRLKVEGGVIYFKGDGNYRSKIGVSPRRAKETLGSYDATGRVLTLAQFTLPGNTTRYVNSMWELQSEPYGGDAVNSYNDGPPAPGAAQMGKFYELESSSPALLLAKGASGTHYHRTYHFHGPEAALDKIAKATLGVGVKKITSAL